MSGLKPGIDEEGIDMEINRALRLYFDGSDFGINYLTDVKNLKNLSLMKQYYNVFYNICDEVYNYYENFEDYDEEQVNKFMTKLNERIMPYINSVLGTPKNNLNLYTKNKIDLKQAYNRIDYYKKVIVPNFLMAMIYFDYYYWNGDFDISFYEYFYPQCETIIKSNLEASNEHGRLNNSVNYSSIFKRNNPKITSVKTRTNNNTNNNTFIKAIKTITNWEDVDFKNAGINESNNGKASLDNVIVVYDGMKVYSFSNNSHGTPYYNIEYDIEATTNLPVFCATWYSSASSFNLSKFQAVLYPDFEFQEMSFKKVLYLRNPNFSDYFDKITFYAIQFPTTASTLKQITKNNLSYVYNLNTGDYLCFNDDIFVSNDITLRTTGTDIIKIFPSNIYSLPAPLLVIYKSTSYTETEINNDYNNDGMLNEENYRPLIRSSKIGDEFLFNVYQCIKVPVDPGVIILSLSDNVKINIDIGK